MIEIKVQRQPIDTRLPDRCTQLINRTLIRCSVAKNFFRFNRMQCTMRLLRFVLIH